MSLKLRAGAYLHLLSHYATVSRHAWIDRDRREEGALNIDEAEFLTAAMALREAPVSPAARVVAILMCGIVVTILVWSTIGKLDISVSASGKVIPSARSKAIASVDTASVRAIYVREGQDVKRGDILIKLDSSASDAERAKALADEKAARIQVARSKALIRSIDILEPPHLPIMEGVSPNEWRTEQEHLTGQYQDFRSKLRVIESDIKRFSDRLPLAIERESDYQSLARTRDVSTHSLLDTEQARIDLEGQLRSARSQKASLIDTTKRDAYDAITEGERTADISHQDAQKAAIHADLMTLTAPVDGSAQQLTVHTVGGVVAGAQTLMIIVPKGGPVQVEAFLEDRDVGFVREGQEAQVKLEPYEYTKYGTISGRVDHVSRDAIEDEKKGLLYSVIVVLDRESILVDEKALPITPGMSAIVDIKTGSRRAIEYVLEPLLQHRSGSLHER